MRMFLKSIGMGMSLWLLAVAASQAEVKYSVQDLGEFTPKAINANGQIVGSTIDPVDRSPRAVLYSNGQLTKLGSLGGGEASAYGVNDDGDVVGYSAMTDGSLHAFLYHAGMMSDVGGFGGGSSFAFGINNLGQIVGTSKTPSGVYHAFLYDNGAMKDLGTLGGANSGAGSINDAHQIVGSAALPDGTRHAFLYQGGSMTDLGSLGGESGASGINSRGQIVGNSYLSLNAPTLHAFLFSDGKMLDLDNTTGVSTATGINDRGEVVGSFANNPFLFSSGQIYNLNDLIDASSEATLTYANAINDNGQIVVTGYLGGDPAAPRAFLLTPVPEPSAFISLGIGLAGICILGVRRRSRNRDAASIGTRLHQIGSIDKLRHP